MFNERYWEEQRPLRNMKYWVGVEGVGVSMLRKLTWVAHKISGQPLADCFFTVQEYWNLYFANLKQKQANFKVGKYKLPSKVPFIFTFLDFCFHLLENTSVWKDNHLKENHHIHNGEGRKIIIAGGTLKPALDDFFYWLTKTNRMNRELRTNIHKLHFDWKEDSEHTNREYAWFYGLSYHSEKIEIHNHKFRWKELLLYREKR